MKLQKLLLVFGLVSAVQAAILSSKVNDCLLLDVAPHSLGIETAGGIMTAVIERNSTIPLGREHVFTTDSDNQTYVPVKIFEGQRAWAKDNKLLGEFELIGIPPAPRGVPQIKVKFDIDADNILKLNARDTSTGKGIKLQTTNEQGHLSMEEIERMADVAKIYEREDETQRQRILAKYTLESYAEYVKSTMQDDKMKVEVADDYRNCIIAKCEEVKDWLDWNQYAEKYEIEHQKKELEKVYTTNITKLYQAREMQGAEEVTRSNGGGPTIKEDD